MATSPFVINTHVVKGQHIRNYPGTTRNGDSDVQYLEVKQYIPHDNQEPHEGDMTVIATQGSSFPKELYEPLFEDLSKHCKQHGVRIRAIWAIDSSNHGGSYVLNEKTLGDDPSTFDYARDVLQVINEFRREMIQPIVGLAHSIASAALIELSTFHPRLFASLIFFDPTIGSDMMSVGPMILQMACSRPDLWPNFSSAEKFFKKSLKSWNPRVLDRWLKYGLRKTPTLLYPNESPEKITLRMPKSQEAWTYGRSFFSYTPGQPITSTHKILSPDIDSPSTIFGPFYRPEIMSAYHKLPFLRPSTLFVFPERVPVPDHILEAKVKLCSSAEKVKIPKVSHLAPFENPEACAKAAAEFLGRDLQAWRERMEFEKKNRDQRSVDGDMVRLSDEFVKRVREFAQDGVKGIPGMENVGGGGGGKKAKL